MIATPTDVANLLGVGAPAGTQKARIEMAIDATIEAVQAYTGRTWDLITDDTEPSARTYPGHAGAITVADVEVADTTVSESSDLVTWTELTATEWHLEPFNGQTANRLVRSCGEFARWVKVEGRHGVFVVPVAVKQAVIIKAAQLVERSPSGVTYGGDFGPIRISRFEDPDVTRLLETVAPPLIA